MGEEDQPYVFPYKVKHSTVRYLRRKAKSGIRFQVAGRIDTGQDDIDPDPHEKTAVEGIQ
jgi:hypothetical protein